jgi:hypothetical protein
VDVERQLLAGQEFVYQCVGQVGGHADQNP